MNSRDALCVAGVVPFSTTDFPGKPAAVLFCQGCPWRCRYCHNPHLRPPTAPGEHAEQVWSCSKLWQFLRSRQGLLDAVVFSGGEPTLQSNLPQAMQRVRALGFSVGLHTAGCYPRRLQRVLPWVDWVGLDIKAPFDSRYDRIVGRPHAAQRAKESLRHLLQSGVDYQLRTTVHPLLLSKRDIQQLQQDLRQLGATPAVLQPFRAQGCVDKQLTMQ